MRERGMPEIGFVALPRLLVVHAYSCCRENRLSSQFSAPVSSRSRPVSRAHASNRARSSARAACATAFAWLPASPCCAIGHSCDRKPASLPRKKRSDVGRKHARDGTSSAEPLLVPRPLRSPAAASRCASQPPRTLRVDASVEVAWRRMRRCAGGSGELGGRARSGDVRPGRAHRARTAPVVKYTYK